MELNFRAMRHGFVDVLVLTGEGIGIEDGEINLIAELIVVVGGGKCELASEEILLNSGLEGAILFRLQIGVGNNKGPAGKGFLQPRLFNSGCIRESQACAGECLSTLASL